MYEVIQCSYKNLPDEVDKEWDLSNNGCGKEYATYIITKYKGILLNVESDAIEPEDKSFGRDLRWIKKALEDAYNFGLTDGRA